MKNYDISKIYQEMELHLISSMKRNLSRHMKEEIKEGFNWEQWQAIKLKELKRYQRENANIIGTYTNPISDDVKKLLKEQFREGNKKAQQEFRKVLKKGYKYDKKLNKSFFGINDRKVSNLINDVNNDLKIANQAALRMVNDEYRQVIHKATMFAANGVMTEKQTLDIAIKDFLNKGINCVEYKNGRRVNIASYAKMAIRTANQRAQLQGEGEFRKKIGNPLVFISKHGTACELCQLWEGKVLIDDVYSGGTKENGNYPLLSDAMNQGLYHPNCEHGLSTYYPELEDIEFNENGPTEETLKQYQDDLNYYNLQIQRFKRLETGSLDEQNINQYKDKLKQWKQKKQNMLTPDEEYAISTYVGSDAYVINDALRNDYALDERLTKVISDLDNALDKLDNYEGNVTRSVYILNDELDYFMKDYKIGNIVELKSYISTTIGDIYNPEARVQMSIKSKKGKNLLKYNESEKEILFKRNSKFQVIQVDTSDAFYVKIDLEEVS